jgi:hypothetical protein
MDAHAAPLMGSAPRLEPGIEPMGDGRMSFSKYIQHEHIEAMRAAFHKVCDALLLNGDVDDPMTEVVVNKIVALAKAGEHDANRLAEHVLNDLVDDGLPPPSDQPRQDDPSPQV